MKNLFLIQSEDDNWYIFQTRNAVLFLMLPVEALIIVGFLIGIGPNTDSYNWAVGIIVAVTLVVGTWLILSPLWMKWPPARFHGKRIVSKRTSGVNVEIRIEK